MAFRFLPVRYSHQGSRGQRTPKLSSIIAKLETSERSINMSDINAKQFDDPPLPDDTPEGHVDEKKSSAVLALEIVEAKCPRLFVDPVDGPSIFIPDDPNLKSWPLHHRRVRSWIAEVVYRECGQPIRERDAGVVLLILEGRAWKLPSEAPPEDGVWERIERDAVAQSLVHFANLLGEFDGPTAELLNKLHQPAIVGRLRMNGLARTLSTSAQSLSRRIKGIAPLLATIGIDLTYHRTESTRSWRLTIRNDVFQREPDAIPVSQDTGSSSGNHFESEGYVRHDATDDSPSEQRLNTLKEIKRIGGLQ